MWTVASAQSTSSPFIQIFFVSRICGSSLRSCAGPGIVPVRLAETSRTGACKAQEVERRDTGHMALRAGSDPDAVVDEELSGHQHLRDARRREGRDASGLEARSGPDLVRPSNARVPRPGGRRDLVLVRPPVAGDERERRAAVADEDEGLDDLRARGADGLGP